MEPSITPPAATCALPSRRVLTLWVEDDPAGGARWWVETDRGQEVVCVAQGGDDRQRAEAAFRTLCAAFDERLLPTLPALALVHAQRAPEQPPATERESRAEAAPFGCPAPAALRPRIQDPA